MFSTTNLYSASALLTVGAEYAGAEKQQNGKVVFRFHDPEGQLADVERSYRRGTLPPVNARTLVDSIMTMRDELTRLGSR